MAASKRQTTFAKLAREQAMRERRVRKQEKKDDKKQAAAALAAGGPAGEAAIDPEPAEPAALEEN